MEEAEGYVRIVRADIPFHDEQPQPDGAVFARSHNMLSSKKKKATVKCHDGSAFVTQTHMFKIRAHGSVQLAHERFRVGFAQNGGV